jgi:putative flippase GtrA
MSRILRTKEKFDAHSQKTAGWLMQFIDFFYPPFRKFIPHQTFRYAACGGANQLLNLAVYTFCLYYVFKMKNWDLGFWVFTPHTASFLVAFVVSFPIGFLLSRYVVFNESDVKGRQQIVRYFSIVGICLVLNLVLLKLFVEVFHWNEVLSYFLDVVIVVTFSFLSQKRFAFKSVG